MQQMRLKELSCGAVLALKHPQLNLAELSISPPGISRNAEETAKLQKVIATLFGLSSGKFGFELLPSPEMWACGFSPENEERINEELSTGKLDLEKMTDEQFEPNAFYYSLKDLKSKPEQEIYGVTHHESAHAQYTSFRNLLLGHKIAEKEGFLPTSWGLVLNGLEDGRINRMKSAESFVIKEQIAALYAPWEKDTVDKIDTQSLISQYALNAVYFWLKGAAIPKGLDPRVERLFKDTEKLVSKFINEDDRQKSFEILKNEIWPKVKHLENEEKKDQQLRETAKENKSTWQKLKDWIREKFKSHKKQPDQPLTNSERNKLEERFNNLPQKRKDEIRKSAEEKTDKKQSEEANNTSIKGFRYELDKKTGKHTLGRSVKPDEKDKELGRKLIEASLDKENEKQLVEIKKEKAEMEMRAEGFEPDEIDIFQEFTEIKDSVTPMKNAFLRKLNKIIPRDRRKDFGGEFHGGPRIDNGKLAKRAPVKDSRFYQKRSLEIKGEPLLNVEIIIDNSPSMEGEKILQAKRAAVLTLEVLSEMGLPSCVKRFSNNYDWIQNRNEIYRNPDCRVKPELILSLDACGNGTNIGAPLEETKEAVHAFRLRHPNTLTLVIVITDGGANIGKTGESLKSLIAETQRKALLVNINIAGVESEIKNSAYLFGERNVIACNNVTELPDVMIKVLQAGFEKAIKKT